MCRPENHSLMTHTSPLHASPPALFDVKMRARFPTGADVQELQARQASPDGKHITLAGAAPPCLMWACVPTAPLRPCVTHPPPPYLHSHLHHGFTKVALASTCLAWAPAPFPCRQPSWIGEGCCVAAIDLARACVRMPAGPSGWCSMPGAQAAVTGPPWPNGQGVGPLIRRLRVRVPQGVSIFP